MAGLGSKAIFLQRKRDDKLRKERREDVQAHETQALATKEQGLTSRAGAANRAAFARQGLANRGDLDKVAAQQKGRLAQVGAQQIGQTERTAMDIAGKYKQETQRQAGLGERQQATIGAGIDAAEAADARKTKGFYRELGAQAYLGGQNPEIAQEFTDYDPEWGMDYKRMPKYQQPSKGYDRIAPKYSSGDEPRLLSPEGAWDKSKGSRKPASTEDIKGMDEEALKLLIERMGQLNSTQGLGR